MLKVIVINEHSDRLNDTGYVIPSHWDSDSFWVPVLMSGKQYMFARRNLRLYA